VVFTPFVVKNTLNDPHSYAKIYQNVEIEQEEDSFCSSVSFRTLDEMERAWPQ